MFNMTKYKLAFTLLLLRIILTNNNCLSSSKEIDKIKDILYHKTLGSLI